MYKMFVDGVLFHDSTLEEMQIESGTITRELNKAGSLKFVFYPDHPHYDLIDELKSLIEVYRQGIDEPIFRGRALSHEDDYYKKRTYVCEGQYNFLMDSVSRPLSFVGTPAGLFAKLVTAHNAQVEAWKRFKVGNVTVEGESVTFTTTQAEPTQNALKKLLLDTYGGYIIPRYEGGVWYLDYLSDFTERGTQFIEFGENLSKFTRKDDFADIVTALIPYGDDDLTVTSVNGNSDIIKNATGVSLYGTIVGTEKFDGVTKAADLLTKATAYLAELIKQKLVIELNAVDMSFLNVNIEALKIATYSRIISEPHNLDDWFLITKQTINLTDPTKDSVVLGGTFSTFTDQTTTTGNAVKTIDNSVGDVVKNSEVILSLTNHIGKSLYSGTFSSGSVDVAGIDGFRLIAVTIEGFAGVVVCANSGSIFAGSLDLVDSSGGTTAGVVHLTVGADTLTFVNAGVISGGTFTAKAITSIYGIV